MTRIGDRGFLFAWQTIRAATQPSSDATTWQVAGVRWSRHRYSQTAPSHAVSIEVHRLDYGGRGETWSFMVVAEHWWDGQHKPLRNNLWATHVSGSRQRIAEWVHSTSLLTAVSRSA